MRLEAVAVSAPEPTRLAGCRTPPIYLIEASSDKATCRFRAQHPTSEVARVIGGYEVARRLRKLESLHDVVLIAVTGYGQASDRERTMALASPTK